MGYGLVSVFCFIGFVASVACLYRIKVMEYFGFETEREREFVLCMTWEIVGGVIVYN